MRGELLFAGLGPTTSLWPVVRVARAPAKKAGIERARAARELGTGSRWQRVSNQRDFETNAPLVRRRELPEASD